MGVAFLLEAALRVIVYNTSTGGTGHLKVTPYIWVAVLSVWTVAYGSRQKKENERLAAMTTGEVAETGPRETV